MYTPNNIFHKLLVLNMWSHDDELGNPIFVKTEYEKNEKSYNSILLSKAIQNELELVIDKNQMTSCKPESMVKPDSIIIKQVPDQPLQTSIKMNMVSQHEEMPFKCYLCERGFRNKTTLINHENTHLGHRPYQCQSCKSNFKTSGELNRHILYKHSLEKRKQCTECDYKCVENEKLKLHMRIHTGERPYQCNDCSYAAAGQFGLKRHIRTHTGEKPYECDVCRIRFSQQNSWKEHKDLHHENKPHAKCLLCPQYISRKRDLLVHNKRFHYSEHPLMCKKCKMTFPDRYNLKKHQKNHDVKYLQCSICNYSCGNERRLQEHSLIHKDSKPFQCDLCDGKFRTKNLIKRHQNQHHNPDYKHQSKKRNIYRCLQCERSFARKQNLEKHLAHHITKTTRQPSIKVQTKTTAKDSSSSPKMRMKRCGHCQGCQAEDCGECAKCLDMLKYGGLGKLKQSCSLRICSNLYCRQEDCNKEEMQEVGRQDMLNEPKKEKQQEHQELQNFQDHETEEKTKVVQEPKNTQQNIVLEDFEMGELDTSNQEMFTEDLETGEIVDVDDETLILLLQKQAGN